MKSDTPPSILFQHLVFPISILCGLSALLGIIHCIIHLFAIPVPTVFLVLTLLILVGLVIAIVGIFWRHKRAIARLDRLLCEICAQDIHVSRLRSSEFWDDFDNLFNRYLSSVNRNYAGELLVRQVEFSTLQSQINPHFLYNTLDSLRGHAMATGADDIANMAEALSHFFRYSISRTGDFVTVQQELDSIGNYFHIQRYRFGEGLILTVSTDQEDDLSGYYMPKLTLQPLVENCIAHGFSDSPTSGTVMVQVVLSRTRLMITVEDTGIGMDAATLSALRDKIDTVIPPQMTPAPSKQGRSTHGGLALNNVNQRIKLFFGQEYGLFISATPNMGTTITLELPLIDNIQQVPSIS